MPCNSDYLQSTDKELQLQRTAKLLVYVYKNIDVKIPKWVGVASREVYCREERTVPLLCAAVTALLKVDKDHPVVYDAKSKEARDLADWWDAHLEADKQRVAAERRKKRSDSSMAKLLKKPMASLTKDEQLRVAKHVLLSSKAK